MKKVLILTVTAGNAHNACAAGMKKQLESLGDCEVKIIDILEEYSDKPNAWFSNGGYNLVVGKMPFFYDAFYKAYSRRPPNLRYSCPSQTAVMSLIGGLYKEIISFKPDVIYSTQYYGSIAVTDLRLVYDIPAVCITSDLDYTVAPFWESGVGVDYFTVAAPDFIDECLYKGYRREQVLPVGIPVDGRTLEQTDKRAARRALGLDEDVFTIMVMFGGGHWNGGFKILKDLIKALTGRTAQIIMINGKNQESFEQVAELSLPEGIKILNVGFTTEIPAHMSAADIILNKCGGASVTEIVNKGLPMLVTEKLVMQEKRNLAYMKNKGVALSFKNFKTLKRNVLKLMDDPELRKEMSEKTLPLKKNAMGEIAALILAQPNADYGNTDAADVDEKEVKRAVRHALLAADLEERQKPEGGR